MLWPECGWQSVSLTDMITAPSVKKVYRKATLCIHPDKVQQKGATLQQKYVAEKVFDLLKVLNEYHIYLIILFPFLSSVFLLKERKGVGGWGACLGLLIVQLLSSNTSGFSVLDVHNYGGVNLVKH